MSDKLFSQEEVNDLLSLIHFSSQRDNYINLMKQDDSFQTKLKEIFETHQVHVGLISEYPFFMNRVTNEIAEEKDDGYVKLKDAINIIDRDYIEDREYTRETIMNLIDALKKIKGLLK